MDKNTQSELKMALSVLSGRQGFPNTDNTDLKIWAENYVFDRIEELTDALRTAERRIEQLSEDTFYIEKHTGIR